MQDNRISEFSGQPRTYWSKLCYNYKPSPPHLTEINWELYDILLKFGRKHSARISSAYVLTFDVVENSKKKAWEPQAVLLWPETHLELSSLATLMLGIIGRDRIAEEMK